MTFHPHMLISYVKFTLWSLQTDLVIKLDLVINQIMWCCHCGVALLKYLMPVCVAPYGPGDRLCVFIFHSVVCKKLGGLTRTEDDISILLSSLGKR